MHNCFVVVADMGEMVPPNVDSSQVPPAASHHAGEQGQADLGARMFSSDGVPEGMQLLGSFFHPPQSMGELGSSGPAPAEHQGASPAPSSAQVQPPAAAILSSLNMGPSLLFRMGGPMPPMPAGTSTANHARSSSTGLSTSLMVLNFVSTVTVLTVHCGSL